jgi:hypothetical protein
MLALARLCVRVRADAPPNFNMSTFWKISAYLGIKTFPLEITQQPLTSTNSTNMAGKRSCDEGVQLTTLKLWLLNGVR